jgi:hypothetical protein
MPGWIGGVFSFLAKAYEFAKLAVAYMMGRKAAQADMEEETDKMVDKADAVEDEIEDMSDDEVQKQLADKWSRNSDSSGS